jgi:hypothetical protein
MTCHERGKNIIFLKVEGICIVFGPNIDPALSCSRWVKIELILEYPSCGLASVRRARRKVCVVDENKSKCTLQNRKSAVLQNMQLYCSSVHNFRNSRVHAAKSQLWL